MDSTCCNTLTLPTVVFLTQCDECLFCPMTEAKAPLKIFVEVTVPLVTSYSLLNSGRLLTGRDSGVVEHTAV